MKLWSLDERREIATLDDDRNLPGRDGAIYGVAFSPDGLTLATAVRDSLVKLWNPTTQREIAALTGHQQRVVSVAFAPNGELLASGGGGTVRLWARAP